MADMTFEEIVVMVDRLTPLEQTQLTTHLLELTRRRQLSADEKMSLLRAAQIDVKVMETPSIRREDWYGDDGR
jgi:hypothetical protein